MSTPWREILIDVEPRGKEFRLGIEEDATAGDILDVIVERCKDEGIDIEKWAMKQVGDDYQFVLLRKAEGNAILPPALHFYQLEPELQNSEKFKLGTQPVVGAGLPATILNHRIDNLVEEFFDSALSDIYNQENWVKHDVVKKKIYGIIHNFQ